MKIKLNALSFLVLLAFISLHLTGCNKCEGTDTKVGETALSPATQSYMTQFVGKKLIFKDSIGREFVLRDSTGLIRLRDTLITGITCQNNWPHRSLFNFIDYESWAIGLTCNDFKIHQKTYMVNEGVKDTSLLQEIFKMDISSKKDSLGMVVFGTEMSKRGTQPNNHNWGDIVIGDTLLNNKKFTNLIKIPLQTNQVFREGYFNKNKGLVAFKLTDKNLWTLDRIE